MLSTRLYPKLMLLFITTTFSLSMLMIVFGKTQPPPENHTAAGFVLLCEGKTQPCWYGIQPVVTTEKFTRRVLKWLGYTIEADRDSCCPGPFKIWVTDLPANSLCRVIFETVPMWADATGERRVQTISRFQLRDCSHLYLKDLVDAIRNPMIAFKCRDMGSVRTYFQGWWLNDPGLTSPTLADDVITSVDYGFSEWYRDNWQIDPLWYGYLSEQELKAITWEKYCQYG